MTRLRKLTLLTATAAALTLPACQGDADTLGSLCTPRQPDADHIDDDAYFHLADMEYLPIGSVGVWITDEGWDAAYGYSAYEDSIIYRTKQCAMTQPEYNSD